MRRSILSAIVPSVGVGYGDYQARIGFTPSPGTRLQLLGFGSYDYLALIDKAANGSSRGDVKTTLLDTDFHRLDLKFSKDLDSGVKIVAGVTTGLDQSRNVGARLAQQYKLAARGGVELPFLAGKGTLRAGLDLSLDDFRVLPCVEVLETDRCAPGDTAFDRQNLIDAYQDLFKDRLDVTVGGMSRANSASGSGRPSSPACGWTTIIRSGGLGRRD